MSTPFFGSSTKTRTTSQEHSTSDMSSNSQSRSVTTPNVPDWITGPVQTAAGRIGDLFAIDPASTVSGSDPLQRRAAAGAAGLSGSPWNIDAAADLARGAANTSWLDSFVNASTPMAAGGRASEFVGDYVNPYLKEVVDTTAADLDANAGQVRAQQDLDLAGSGAFGGSGAAITKSMTEGELQRARGTTLGGLRSRAYETALSAAAGDADRATQASISNAQTTLQDRGQRAGFGFQGRQLQLGAANQLVDLSNAYDANTRANIATQADLGNVFRAIDTETRRAPITTAQQIAGMFSGLPLSLFPGQTTETTGSQTSHTDTMGSTNSTTKGSNKQGIGTTLVNAAAQAAGAYAGAGG